MTVQMFSILFYISNEDHRFKYGMIKKNATTTKEEASLNYYCKFVHKDLVDSLHVVATFFHAWITINILLGLLSSFKEKFIKLPRTYKAYKIFENGIDEEEIQKTSYDFILLKRSCVARVICLSNQKTTYLKSPTANIVAETLR